MIQYIKNNYLTINRIISLSIKRIPRILHKYNTLRLLVSNIVLRHGKSKIAYFETDITETLSEISL